MFSCASPGEYVNKSVASLSLRQMGCRGRGRYLFMSVLLLACLFSCCGFVALAIYALRKRLAGGHRSVWGSYRYGPRLAAQDADAEPEVAVGLGGRPPQPPPPRPPPGYSKTAAASGKAEVETGLDSDSKAAGALFSVDESPSASASASRERTNATPLLFIAGDKPLNIGNGGGQLETHDQPATGDGDGEQAISDTTTHSHSSEQADTKNEYGALKRDVNPTRYKPDGKKAVIVIHENA